MDGHLPSAPRGRSPVTPVDQEMGATATHPRLVAVAPKPPPPAGLSVAGRRVPLAAAALVLVALIGAGTFGAYRTVGGWTAKPAAAPTAVAAPAPPPPAEPEPVAATAPVTETVALAAPPAPPVAAPVRGGGGGRPAGGGPSNPPATTNTVEVEVTRTVIRKPDPTPEPTPKPIVYARGDINKDGRVDCTDLNTLRSQWGGSGSADLNKDGTVGTTDLSMLLSDWNKGGSGSAAGTEAECGSSASGGN